MFYPTLLLRAMCVWCGVVSILRGPHTSGDAVRRSATTRSFNLQNKTTATQGLEMKCKSQSVFASAFALFPSCACLVLIGIRQRARAHLRSHPTFVSSSTQPFPQHFSIQNARRRYSSPVRRMRCRLGRKGTCGATRCRDEFDETQLKSHAVCATSSTLIAHRDRSSLRLFLFSTSVSCAAAATPRTAEWGASSASGSAVRARAAS